jgi:hypothetical protein
MLGQPGRQSIWLHIYLPKFQLLCKNSERSADPPIRRSADPPIRRSADPPIRRSADPQP